MERIYSFKKCFVFILIFHLVTYLAWSFIEFDFYEPIRQTLKDEDSRGFYICYFIISAFFSIPYYDN